MNYCQSCGCVIEENLKFCAECGASMSGDENLKSKQSEAVQPEKIVECNVKTAEIYYDGARLEAVGKVQLQAGTNRFYIRGISKGISTATIQLSFGGLSFRFYEPKMCTIAKDQELEKKIAAKNREMEILKIQEELLEKNADFTGKSDIKPEEIIPYLSRLTDTLREIDAKHNALEEEVKDLQEKLQEDSLYLMEVEVECMKEGEYAFTVLYVTRDAKWSPFYDVFASKDNSILLQLKAKICQQMEKDWDNCHIILCSGTANRSGNLPQLRPMYYRGEATAAKREPLLTEKGMARGLTAAAPMQQMMCLSAAPEAVAEYSSEIKAESVVRYTLKETYRIIHGEKGSVLPIQSFHANGEFRYECCPKLDNRAYLTAEIKDLAALHLMKCNANIFMQGNYVGETYIDPEQAEHFALSLGRDERIKINYEEKKSSHSKAFIKNTQSQIFDFAIQIENHTENEVELRVYDQIPVSLSQEIKVEQLKISEGMVDKEDGKITWSFSLKPDEKKELEVNYSVNWPKNTPLR